MSSTFAVTVDNGPSGREVYVYVRGLLVMKRWLGGPFGPYSALFQVAPSFTYWLVDGR